MSYMAATSASHFHLPERKPMLMARRVSLFQREIRISLSSAAIEILLDQAAVLSEGHVDGEAYFGSTMITFDLARASHLVSDPCDAAAARRFCDQLAAEPRVRARARELAQAEAERIAGGELAEVTVDLRARASGAHIDLDLDVEAQVVATTIRAI
jgi:hypothetical protein